MSRYRSCPVGGTELNSETVERMIDSRCEMHRYRSCPVGGSAKGMPRKVETLRPSCIDSRPSSRELLSLTSGCPPLTITWSRDRHSTITTKLETDVS